MKFFDSLIDKVNGLLAPLPCRTQRKSVAWKDAGKNQVIMRRDTAFELDGIGFNLVTNNNIKDETIVIGSDLPDIKSNSRFARISIIQLDDIGDEQQTYNLIKKVEYVKYHTFPDGYMMRSTSRSHKEAVRVAKSAIKSGIDFNKVGSLMIEKYKEIPAVKGVKMVFVTSPDAEFDALEKLAEKNAEIAQTLNHVMNSVNFDCSTCNLKAVCDEVEGMKELHFKNAGMN